MSLYLPSGSSGPHRQASKYRFLEAFLPHLARLVGSGREVILCGDWNIAHQPIDLKNWRSNQKNSGFLPDERAWLTRVFDELGFVDVFRQLNGDVKEYSWWDYRTAGFDRNHGLRIDHIWTSPPLAERCLSCWIDRTPRGWEKPSDHAPVIADFSVT